MPVGKKSNVNSNPFISAGLISKAFFWWLKDLISYGRKHNIVADDLYDPTPDDLSEHLRKSLEIEWQKEIENARTKKRKPKLWYAFAKTYGWDFVKLSIFPVGFCILLSSGPSFLELMMSYFRPMSTINPVQAYINATIFIILMALRAVLFNAGSFHLTELGMRSRIAFTSLIYKKMIRLSSSSCRSGSSVTSLITVDVSKCENFFAYSPFVVIVPFQLFATTFLIWQYVDLQSSLVIIVLMIFLTLPIQILYKKMGLKLRRKQTARTAERISLIGEIISGIRAVKMYVWENYFERCVDEARRFEIRSYLKISYLASAVQAFSIVGHRVGIFILILICVPHNGTITANQVLPVAVHLFNIRMCLFVFFFFGIRNITDMSVSMKRIEDFLLLQEVDLHVENVKDNTNDEIISLNNVTVSLNDQSAKDKKHILRNVNLNLSPNNLYVIVGAVGSGKSSLLKLILQEVQLASGQVSVNGKLSYASQEPWLFPASIRDNILFGEIYDEERYEKVVSACALLEDLAQLPYADQTMVADKGRNLSGGQCARINLARAVYREADIYLFDNPLSAVDTRVAKKLMDECINKLLENKTRLLVTHNIQLLNDLDEIIFLNSSKVEFRGTLENFRRHDSYLKLDLAIEQAAMSDCNLETLKLTAESESNQMTITRKVEKEPTENMELIAKGAVGASVYSRYIKAGGICHALILLLLHIIVVVSLAIFDYEIVAWVQNDDPSSKVAANTGNNHPLLLGILIVFIISITLFLIISSNRFLLDASSVIHSNMFSKLINTSLRFFDTNTCGQILNRFSEDTNIVDDALPEALLQAIQSGRLAMALLLTAVIVNWWVIFPIGISMILYFMIGRIYLRSMQQMGRLAGIAKSPLLAFAASSLDGATTIRACKAETIVCREFDSRQDRHTSAYFLVKALNPANALWFELSSQAFLASVLYFSIILKNEKSDAYIGLALMQIMNTTMSTMSILVKACAALSYMPNVERMLQFTDLEPEDIVDRSESSKVEKMWPDKGEIIFEKLYLRYTDEDCDPVLWDLNFTIVAGSRVGIVGRTGAGKSSLISALFRLTAIEGSLLIDGVDIKNVDLPKLRSKLSIIPQQPFLFKGSLRMNLDPLNEFEDALLWSALDDVELKPMFTTLEYSIDMGGSNLSLGQRQLVCLARAILKQNKILILDEATANIDLATDALIQKTIRNKFNRCTVLTIAHRLNTVMDSDKILVMDNGRVVEYDHPHLLLGKNDGYFSKMVRQTDNATLRQLTTIAEKAYMKLQQTSTNRE